MRLSEVDFRLNTQARSTWMCWGWSALVSAADAMASDDRLHSFPLSISSPPEIPEDMG